MGATGSPAALFAQAKNFLAASPYGPILILLGVLLAALLIILPLVRKFRRKRIKQKETRDIMKDLLTWRHLSQLVKGGDEHNKAKQELSDNIVRINELLKQGFFQAAKNSRNAHTLPWFALVGEPRSGKSTLLEASGLELLPSTEENNPGEDPKNSLPVRMWIGAKAVICDISGKVFFDRWLDASSAEWVHIIRQLCRRRRRKTLEGIIITIPADALLADDDNLSSKKAILMANELGKLLGESGMRLPCYVIVTKLDLTGGFQEYAGAFTGDLRHQILGFENDTNLFNEESFKRFWDALGERLRSGAKQLLFPAEADGGAGAESRMDRGGKIWLFPHNFSGLYKNLKTYLEILFGEHNFHGTGNTIFEGVFFTSARDMGFSLSPDIAALAGLNADGLPIPSMTAALDKPAVPADPGAPVTALVAVNAARTLIAPYLEKTSRLRGYFIRDLLHRRILAPAPHAEFVRKEAARRHVPYYALCALMVFLGSFWLFSAVFKAGPLRVALIQAESFYEWLDPVLRKGGPFRSPLIKEDAAYRITLNNDPIDGEALSSRLQLYYNALAYRDLKIPAPLGFKVSEALAFGFDRNMGYRRKAFIANQLHKAMVRIPVVKYTGNRLMERIDTQTLDTGAREVIASFVSLDDVQGVDFYRFFSTPRFKLDAMIRYLMPDLADDTMELLNNYLPQYDSSHTIQMDVNYMYSGNYGAAKQAALDTMVSAWKRRAVYPDSIYGKIKNLAAIAGEITGNYREITGELNGINSVSTIEEVAEAVYRWRRLTGRFASLAAEGRSIFEETRLLLRAAHIPLGFETLRSAFKLPGTAKAQPDAFGDNLINDYLFNGMVIDYAVREYTRLFEEDMAFVTKKLKDGGGGLLGHIVSERNAFSGGLSREVEGLRGQARLLQEDELLSQKLDGKPDSPSLFMVAEKILSLASAIPVPQRDALEKVNFETNWRRGQDHIKAALDAYEVFVKPYHEAEKTALLIGNARIMLLAEAYYNRYTIFTTSLAFLNTFAGNIAAEIASRLDGTNLFAFSGDAIENLFGGFYYNRGYDPPALKLILDNVASFAALFAPGEDSGALPLFLRNVDKRVYLPDALMDYLASYIAYWGAYPGQVYVSAGTWERFLERASRYKSFQINSVLLAIYVKSLEGLNQLDDSLLSPSLSALKNQYLISLGDQMGLLNQFQSADAEKMFSAWTALPPDPLEAYKLLRAVPEADLQHSYLAVYTGPGKDAGPDTAAGIGWWNSFVIDGASLLARRAGAANMARLMERMPQYKAFPLYGGASRQDSLSLSDMGEIASLFEALGAGISGPESADPVAAALSRNFFQGGRVQNWAETLYRISKTVSGAEKPLSWTIHQPPAEAQSRLPADGRLLAINRFRYIEASAGGAAARMSSTYMNEKTALLRGNPNAGNLVFKFYKTSRDALPGAVVSINNPWAAFTLYLQKDRATDDKGGVYIPLYLEDEAGKYVYHIQLEFNGELPGPASWYAPGNWPDIMISGGMIQERR
ncbi:MAG: hypothetical protein LBD37_06900 [Treponema sp.]|jgi:hypothetical protein|nr:hypothetical protein [Treponema sp.]